MFTNALKTANELGDTGLCRVRTILIYCGGYCGAVVGIRILCFLHWLKGDLNEWMENLATEINKRD